MSVIVTVFYSVGAAYVTDSSGPGSNVGNLYFATWFGFGLSVLLTFSSLKEMIAPEPVVEEESQHPSEVRKPADQPGEEGEQQGGESPEDEQLEEVEVGGGGEP